MAGDLEHLGPGGPEDLIGALAIKALGVDVQIMGGVRDRGWALYTGPRRGNP